MAARPPETPLFPILPYPPWFGGREDWARFFLLLLLLYPLYRMWRDSRELRR